MSGRVRQQPEIGRMMRFHALRLALTLSPMLLIVGCASSSGIGCTAQVLENRMQTQLKSDIAAGRVTLEKLPDGTRVTIAEQSLYPNGKTELDDTGRSVLTNVIEALLEPALLQIAVADSPATPAGLQASHVDSVTQYFKDAGLEAVLQPAAPPQETPAEAAGTIPQGLTITVKVIAS